MNNNITVLNKVLKGDKYTIVYLENNTKKLVNVNKNNVEELNKYGISVDTDVVAAEEVLNKGIKKVNTIMTQDTHRYLISKFNGIKHGKYAVMLNLVPRAVKGENGKIEITGVGRRTAETINPYTEAIMNHAGEFNKTNSRPLDVYAYDEKEGEFRTLYSVICNSEDSKYFETNYVMVVDFKPLMTDIRKIYNRMKIYNKAVIQKRIELEIQKIIDSGLVLKFDNNSDVTIRGNEGKIEQGEFVSRMLSFTPSNERNATATFTALKPEVAYELIDKICGSTIKTAIEKQETVKALIKFAKRLGMLGTSCVKFGTLGTEKYGVMIYKKTIVGPVDYNSETLVKLSRLGIDKKIDNNTFDGAAKKSVEWVHENLPNIGINVSYKNALLFDMQTRSSVILNKTLDETVSKREMMHECNLILSKVDPSRVLRLMPGQNVDGLDYNDYDVIIVGNPNNIAFLADENGAKAISNLDLKTLAQGHFDNYVLDIAKSTDTCLSLQALQKFLKIDGISDIVKKILYKEFNDRLLERMKGDLDARNCSLASFIFRYIDGGKTNRAAIEEIIKEEIKVFESKIKGLNLKIRSKFLRALFDRTYVLTDGKLDYILGKNKYTGKLEAYSRDIEIEYADEIEAIYNDDSITNKDEALAKLLTGIAIKYPSPSPDENAPITFLTLKQIKKRIYSEDKLSKDEKEILFGNFASTSYGIIKLAPSNTIKHRLAGMDTDYDGIAVILEKELVDLLLDQCKEIDGTSIVIA